MLRLALLLWVGAQALSAQFLEFQINFDDGGCVSCAESLKGRMERVRGVETVTLNLDEGTIRLELAPDNRVRLVPLMSRVEQGGAKALKTRLTAKGLLTDSGQTLALQGAAAGQTYAIRRDVDALEGLIVVEATLMDGVLAVTSIRPAE